MKFYRVSYSQEGGNSGGFSWHTSRREAVAAAQRDYDKDPDEYDNHAKFDDRIEPINIVPTKAGILKALTHFASHNDNG